MAIEIGGLVGSDYLFRVVIIPYKENFLIMTKQTVAEETRQVIAQMAHGYDLDWATPERSLRKEMGMDSLDITEVAIELEDRFDIHLPDSAVNSVKTVQDFCDIVEKEIRKRP
jgi:acyl carrier protein